jgi:TolA-binding protein
MKSISTNTKILFIILSTSLFFFHCGAPKVEEDFLAQDYYQSFYQSKLKSDSILSFKIDSLTKELEKIDYNLRGLEKDKNFLDTNIDHIQDQIEDFKKLKNTSITKTSFGDQSSERKDASSVDATISAEKANLFESDYKRAVSLFNSKNYKEAIPIFHKLLVTKDKVADLTDNIYYWLAECYFGLKQYPNAIDYFDQVLAMENSNKTEDALMMLGNSYEKIGNTEFAKMSYQKIINNYPNSKYFEKAKIKLTNLK